jgi:tetratricopeptide (TPR) repeat protein
MPALESVINSGFLPAAEKDNFVLALGNMYYNNKNYTKAIEWFKRYEKESPTPEKVRPSLIRAYYLGGDYATAKTLLLPVVAASDKAGTAPSQEDLRLLASSATKLKDDATYAATLDKLVTFYPTDELWTDAIYRGVLRKPGFDVQANMIEALRLQFAAIKKLDPEAYTELAELALQAGFPTEAKKVIDAGYAEGVLGTGSNATKHRQLRERATKGANDDAKNIAAGEASAAKSKNGAGLVNLGWAYVTMDQFDKGIGFIEQGIAKGGLKQPDDAKLRLGMAQAKAGRKADAIKTFQGVKAGGGLADIAKYWIMLVNGPAQAAQPASAATAAK